MYYCSMGNELTEKEFQFFFLFLSRVLNLLDILLGTLLCNLVSCLFISGDGPTSQTR